MSMGSSVITMNFVTTQGTIQSQLVIGLDDFNQAMQNFKEEMLGELQSRMAKAEGESRSQELMTAKAVAAMLGVTLKTLNLWDKRGYLPKVKIGAMVRYRRSDVERVAQVKGR